MSGFPPPSPPDKNLNNFFKSPFSEDESSGEEKEKSRSQNTSVQQTATAQQHTQGDQSTSTSAKSKGPWLRTKPSQSSLSPPVSGDTTKVDNQQQHHTAPKVSPRGNGGGLQQITSPPADLPPALPSTIALPQANTNQGASQGSLLSPLPKASNKTAVTGSATMINTTTTTTNTTTTKNSSKAETHSYLIPELQGVTGKRVIGHTLLAKQLIQAESHGYTETLTAGKVDAILRGKVWLKEERDDAGKTIPQDENQNAITRFCEPFMRHYFDTPAMRKNLHQVTENYNKEANSARKLYGELGAYNFNRNEEVQKIMTPVIAPIVDCICGEDNTIQSSEMPATVRAAMLSLDEEVQKWYKTNGGNDPNELLLARKNALVGIFGVRAFLPDYATNLLKDETVPKGHYQPLAGFLMAELNKRLNQLVDSVISCPAEQRDLIKREAVIAESRPVLPKSELEKIDQAKERFQNRKPSSLLVRLKDTVEGIGSRAEKSGATSPRRELKRQGTVSKESPVSDSKEPKSPRSAEGGKKSLVEENTDAREIKKARNRQTVLNDYLKTLKLHAIKDLHELADILRRFKEKIVSSSAAEYKSFKNEPDRFFHGFLREFIVHIQSKGADPSPALTKYFIGLSNKLGLDDSE